VAAQKRAACDVLKGPPRSSRDDPEFMNTFFKASRLHFIGTWKVRLLLQKRHCRQSITPITGVILSELSQLA
jgi:hypothetical protein